MSTKQYTTMSRSVFSSKLPPDLTSHKTRPVFEIRCNFKEIGLFKELENLENISKATKKEKVGFEVCDREGRKLYS